METPLPYKIASAHELGCARVGNPTTARSVKLGLGTSPTENFSNAAVGVLMGGYESLVAKREVTFLGARFSFDPLCTTSQRYWKLTKLKPVAPKSPYKYFCPSPQLHLETTIAVASTDCSPSSRFLALLISCSSSCESWLIAWFLRTIYSTKRRDCGYHRCFPCLSNPPILSPKRTLLLNT